MKIKYFCVSIFFKMHLCCFTFLRFVNKCSSMPLPIAICHAFPPLWMQRHLSGRVGARPRLYSFSIILRTGSHISLTRLGFRQGQLPTSTQQHWTQPKHSRPETMQKNVHFYFIFISYLTFKIARGEGPPFKHINSFM